MRNREKIAWISTIVLSALLVTTLYMHPLVVTVVEEPKVTGYVEYIIETSHGTYVFKSHNIVVTIGKRRVRNLLLGNATDPTNATKYIALSNDASPDASWTKLPNEITGSGLARAAGTVTIINSTAFQVEHKFTASATVTVQCSGLHWSPDSGSDGNLFAANTFTQVTLNQNDNITVRWTVNIG